MTSTTATTEATTARPAPTSLSLPRREFLALSAGAALASLVAGPVALAGAAGRGHAGQPLKILILGGTGFLGPAVIDSAKARGHTVTTFNRGRREKFYGARDGVEKLYGNRDPNRHAGVKFVDGKEIDDESTPKGLSELQGRAFDAVVDTSGQAPRIVKASAELLAPGLKRYVYISSLSAYKRNDQPGDDETAELATMADPAVEDMGAEMQNYGALKALCEQAAEAAVPGRAINIRPGYIVGPGDTSDRFTYWPVRLGRAGEVLCPGAATDPVQFIDVRDLADWIIHAIETGAAGAYNASGPSAGRFTAGEMLAACQGAAGRPPKDTTLTWIPYEALEKLGCPTGMLPILLPSDGEFAGFHTRKMSRAIAAGLKFRPAQTTCKDTLDWWPKAIQTRAKAFKEQAEQAVKDGRKPPQIPDPARLRAGLTDDREAEILKNWKDAPPKG